MKQINQNNDITFLIFCHNMQIPIFKFIFHFFLLVICLPSIAKSKNQIVRTVTETERQAIAEILDGMIYVPPGSITVKLYEPTVDFAYEDSVIRSTGFWLGRTEVTQKQWQAIMGYNNSTDIGDNFPVDNVSWFECQIFITRLKEFTGISFRIPNLEEWRYAAFYGNEDCSYAGSDSIDEVAWYWDNSGLKLHPVAQKKPNKLGFYDMTGNASEWVGDPLYNRRHWSMSKTLIQEIELFYNDTILKEGVAGEGYKKVIPPHNILGIYHYSVGGDYGTIKEDSYIYHICFPAFEELQREWATGLRLAFSLNKVYQSSKSVTYERK